MQSVLVIIALIILFIYIYGYALDFYDKHRSQHKKMYIPMNNLSDIETFTVGGNTDYNTCSPGAKYGDDNFCYNGSCVNVSGTDNKTYQNCECVKPFAGKYCKQNIGVQVLIHDNFTSPTVIERVPMFKYEGHDYFIQDNDYL